MNYRSMWKWALFAALIATAAGIQWWPKKTAPPAKVELLPYSDSPPASNGSYPYLVISPVAGSDTPKFKAALLSIAPTIRHQVPVNEFDVDLHTGRFILRQTDLFVQDSMPLSLTRTYIAWDYHTRAFGVGANHPYDICPTGTRFPYTYMDLNLEDSYQVHMPRISKGTGYADAVFRHSDTSSEFYGAQIAWNGDGWTMTFLDGRKIYFPEAYLAKNYAQGAATAMVDADGHRIELKRDKDRNLQTLISPNGSQITFTYDSSSRIRQAKDDQNNVRTYFYDGTGHLQAVSDATHVLYRFEYAPLLSEPGYDPWLLTRILDGNWHVLLENKYSRGRIAEQRLADSSVFHYEYELSGREVLGTTVTFPDGERKTLSFRDGILIGQN